jgi:transcriptional regulator with XRE-family HTH domain
MEQRGLNDADLGDLVGAKRQAVHRWRSGGYPSEEHFDAICVALNCTPDQLLTRQPHAPPMLTINEWARRENIPVPRAKDLFALRLLTGETHTARTILVPERVRAPEHSKKLVLMAKRRPRWVPTFHANFPRLMQQSGLSFALVGEKTGVNSTAVRHWVHGRNYPMRDRLPLIAKVLRVSVQELVGPI